MTARVFVLLTQDDIIDFRLGHRPANFLARDFPTRAESQAYQDGVESIGDEHDSIENLKVVGSKVTYTRQAGDPELDARADVVEIELDTPEKAAAYCRGMEDAEGYMAPLVIDDTDERFEQLQEWSAAGANPIVG